MKKILMLLLLFAMLLTLVACGEKTMITVSPIHEASESETLDSDESAPTEESEALPTEESQASGLSGAFGTSDGNVYENEYLGLGCDLDDSWYIYNESELASLLGVTTDLFNNENLSNLIEQSGTAFVFYALKQDGTSANITLEKSSRYSAFLTEQTYVDVVIPSLKSALPSAGFENLNLTSGTTTFLGEEKPCIFVEAEISGTPIYEILVPIIKDDYIATVTVCTISANTCADVMAEFYLIAK